VAIEIIEHLENPAHFLRQLRKMLVPDGIIFLTSPNTHNAFSKALFVTHGLFLEFMDQDYARYGHITPLGLWQLRKIYERVRLDLLEEGSTGYPLAGAAWPRMVLLARLIRYLSREASGFDGKTYTALLRGARRGVTQGLRPMQDRDEARTPQMTDPVQREGALPFPREAIAQTLHGRFEIVARQFASRLALSSPTVQWSYAELDRRANCIAWALKDCGVDRGARVALLYPHEGTMVAAMLGALKAGATYLPLDSGAPLERLAYLLDDSGTRWLLTDEEGAKLTAPLSQGRRVEVIDTDMLQGGLTAALPDSGAGPDDSAYILYTSGSTGQPKGIIQSHRNLMHHIQVWTGVLGITCHDRMTLVSAFTWDSSLQDTYGALLNGATAYVFDIRQQGFEALADLVLGQRLTICHLAVPVYRNLVRVLAQRGRAADLRVMGLGADMVHQADVDAFHDLFGDAAMLVNAYGATESTTGTVYRIGQHSPVPRYPLPIGRAVEDTEVQLVDEDDRPVEGAGTGEITLTSRYVALGYINRPELTAEKFRPHPLDPALRTYRTGDIGQRLPDGNLVLLGRRDHQIKIRGMRVDLGEVESILVQHEDILDAVVLDQMHPPSGAKRLVAYVVAKPGKAVGVATLRAFLDAKLPAYMHPSALLTMPAMPLTPNGKVNRKALPQPDWGARIVDNPYVAPRDALEGTIARVIATVLGVERVGVHDHFLELGGDSLLALEVVLEAAQQGLRLLPGQVLARPTVAELAQVAQVLPAAHSPDAGVAETGSDQLRQWDELRILLPDAEQVEHVYPLSPTQKGIYHQHLMALRDSGVYMEQTRLTLRGPLDAERFGAAWSCLIDRHAILRTTFVRRGLGQPHQVVRRHAPTPLRVEDWRSRPSQDSRRDLSAEQDLEIRRGFGLAGAPPMRLVLLRTGDDRWEFIWTYHHILLDGWSEKLLLNEFFGVYAALEAGLKPVLPPRLSYRTYIDWIQRQDAAEARRFWAGLLAGYTQPVRLATEMPQCRPEDGPAGFVSREIELDGSPLQATARQLRVSLSTLVHGIWSLVLARACAASDVVFGTVVSGRESGLPGIEGLIGLVVDTLAVRVNLVPEAALGDWLRSLHQDLLDARLHAGRSDLGEIERLSEVAPDQLPLFESVVVYLNLPAFDLGQAGTLPLQVAEQDFRSLPHFPLTLFVSPLQPMLARAVYRGDAFGAERVDRLLRDLESLAKRIAQSPEQPLARLLKVS
jgi:amino acid adenylation domain-containing protein